MSQEINKKIDELAKEEKAKEVIRTPEQQKKVVEYENEVLKAARLKWPLKHNFTSEELNTIRKELKGGK